MERPAVCPLLRGHHEFKASFSDVGANCAARNKQKTFGACWGLRQLCRLGNVWTTGWFGHSRDRMSATEDLKSERFEKSIQVMLVDDHPVLRAGVKSLL